GPRDGGARGGPAQRHEGGQTGPGGGGRSVPHLPRGVRADVGGLAAGVLTRRAPGPARSAGPYRPPSRPPSPPGRAEGGPPIVSGACEGDDHWGNAPHGRGGSPWAGTGSC